MTLRDRIAIWVPWFGGVAMLLAKPFPFLHKRFPKAFQDALESWDWPMILTFVFSFGRKAYIDQPCEMRDPATFDPLVDVDERFRITPDDIERFYERGYLGPFTLCSPEEMKRAGEEVMSEIEKESAIYGEGEFQKLRDRHLDCSKVHELVTRPELTERLAQLLGPNLLLWRSQVFLKEPGAPEVTWHQASTYLSEELYRATLYPPDRNRLFQLTTWLAFDDVDEENGYLQFVPGTHRRIEKIKMGGKDTESFGNAKIKLDYDIGPNDAVGMEMKAGQFVIFTERVIHGSPPNRSEDRRRWGMAFRAIQPDVQVYGEGGSHMVAYLKQRFDLSRWGTIMIRGKDDAGVNPILEPFSRRGDEPQGLAAGGRG